MNIHASKPAHLPLLVAGVAAILVSGIAIASLGFSLPVFDGIPTAEAVDDVPAPATAIAAARASRCRECGVVESLREIPTPEETAVTGATGWNSGSDLDGIDIKSAHNYEITIRLQDGSMRVITDANPAQWKNGERVKIIAGLD